MAIFRPGALIGGISGAIGGVVFSNNRGSRVVRHRPAVKGGRAPRHGPAQAKFRAAQSAWATLDEIERAAWRTFATQVPTTNRLGEQHALSAFQVFVRFNIRSQMFGLGISDDPITSHVHPIPETLTITSGVASGITMLLSPDVGAPLYNILIYGAMNMSLTVPQSYSNWRLIGVQLQLGDSPVSITAIWETAWTLPLLNQPIAIRADSYTRHMQPSSSIITTATTVA